jgi:hypothetical protein
MISEGRRADTEPPRDGAAIKLVRDKDGENWVLIFDGTTTKK